MGYNVQVNAVLCAWVEGDESEVPVGNVGVLTRELGTNAQVVERCIVRVGSKGTSRKWQ